MGKGDKNFGNILFLFFGVSVFDRKLGLVQSDMLKGNTFQDSTTAKNTSNILLKQKLRAIQRSAGLRKVLPCFEPCRKLLDFDVFLQVICAAGGQHEEHTVLRKSRQGRSK